MKKVSSLIAIAAIFAFVSASLLAGTGLCAQKIKVGSAQKASVVLTLPLVAAEDQGFWQKNGLDVEVVTFSAATPMYQGVAAGSLNLGTSTVPSIIQAASGGLPVLIITALTSDDDFYLYVPTKSPVKTAQDLKGRKLGISRYGGVEHAYGMALIKALHLAKDVKVVSTGGVSSSLAALKVGGIDAIMLTPYQMINLELSGDVRRVASLSDFRSKRWVSRIAFATRNLLKTHPDVVRRAAKSVLDAERYISANPAWSIGKLKTMFDFSDEAAKKIYDMLEFVPEGSIDKEALTNVRSFMIDYGIIVAEKAPPVDELYTTEFVK